MRQPETAENKRRRQNPNPQGLTPFSASPITVFGSPLSTPDVYDFEDRLIIRRKPDGSGVNLSYDADGILRQKTVLSAGATLVSATGYLTDVQNPTGYAQVLEERVNTAAGTTIRTYAYGSDLVSRTVVSTNSSPLTEYFLYDGSGSVRELTNESGAVTDSYAYDAFGILTGRTGTSDNPFLYRGERYESDIGQYYLRARFYSQETGRFWNQDTYEGSPSDPMSLHKYLYAGTNPLLYSDPSGRNFTAASVLYSSAIVGAYAVIAVVAIQAIYTMNAALPPITFEFRGTRRTGEILADGSPIAEVQVMKEGPQTNPPPTRNRFKTYAPSQPEVNEEDDLPVLIFDKAQFRYIAPHIESAQYGGSYPAILNRGTGDDTPATENRRAALRKYPRPIRGWSWDEYPFASSLQGGSDTSIRLVPLRENSTQGGVISQFYQRRVKPGGRFVVTTKDSSEW